MNTIDEIHFLPDGFVKVGFRGSVTLRTMPVVLTTMKKLGLIVDRAWRRYRGADIYTYFLVEFRGAEYEGRYLTFKLQE